MNENYKFIRNIHQSESVSLDLYFNTKLNQNVVIKKISKNNYSTDDYISEISAQVSIQSEGVINTYESFSDANNYFIVMEAGTRSLMSIIMSGRLTEKTLKLLIYPVFIGLMKLHKNKIIHHDIKPENLVLCKTTGRLKIIDFGLAEICEEEACKLKSGTWPYLSPEHLKNEMCSSKTDVWSLGIVMFLSLTGIFPYNSNKREIYQWKVVNENPDFSHLHKVDISSSAFFLIQSMLIKDPRKRPSIEECLKMSWFRN